MTAMDDDVGDGMGDGMVRGAAAAGDGRARPPRADSPTGPTTITSPTEPTTPPTEPATAIAPGPSHATSTTTPTPTATPSTATLDPVRDAPRHDDPASAPEARPEVRRRRRLVRSVAIVLAVVLGTAGAGWLALRWLRPHPYSGTVMQAPTAAPSMDGLVFSDGTPVDLAAFDGDLVLVYFGYTSCPDVCPTTLSQVAAARRRLGDDAERVQVLLISIDPEHDDLATLGEYVTAFDPDFLAATGDLADVERVATQYGIFFAEGETVGGRPTIDHTATLMGVDTDGHLRIVWPSVLEVERLAADLDELL